MVGMGVEDREQHEVLHARSGGGADQVAVALVVDLLGTSTAATTRALMSGTPAKIEVQLPRTWSRPGSRAVGGPESR